MKWFIMFLRIVFKSALKSSTKKGDAFEWERKKVNAKNYGNKIFEKINSTTRIEDWIMLTKLSSESILEPWNPG